MAVRQGHELLDLLEARLGESDAVDIAVAWAARGLAIDELGEFCDCGGVLRIVVGIDGNSTDPAVLRRLARRLSRRGIEGIREDVSAATVAGRCGASRP